MPIIWTLCLRNGGRKWDCHFRRRRRFPLLILLGGDNKQFQALTWQNLTQERLKGNTSNSLVKGRLPLQTAGVGRWRERKKKKKKGGGVMKLRWGITVSPRKLDDMKRSRRCEWTREKCGNGFIISSLSLKKTSYFYSESHPKIKQCMI